MSGGKRMRVDALWDRFGKLLFRLDRRRWFGSGQSGSRQKGQEYASWSFLMNLRQRPRKDPRKLDE